MSFKGCLKEPISEDIDKFILICYNTRKIKNEKEVVGVFSARGGSVEMRRGERQLQSKCHIATFVFGYMETVVSYSS